MVRLVASCNTFDGYHWTGFQFQYGAIGGLLSSSRMTVWACFNSSMVRLVAKWSATARPLTLVSIPVWCDWWWRLGALPDMDRVSIPVWCDWWCQTWTGRDVKYYVSIPVWCDWWHFTGAWVHDLFKFQFQYGAIGGESVEYIPAFLKAFQFQYGAIGGL